MKSLNQLVRARYFVPKGRRENSRAFQRWVRRQKFSSPEGTAEIGVTDLISHSVVPSGLTFLPFNPALKRRAIFKCPIRDSRNRVC